MKLIWSDLGNNFIFLSLDITIEYLNYYLLFLRFYLFYVEDIKAAYSMHYISILITYRKPTVNICKYS